MEYRCKKKCEADQNARETSTLNEDRVACAMVGTNNYAAPNRDADDRVTIRPEDGQSHYSEPLEVSKFQLSARMINVLYDSPVELGAFE